MMSDADHLSCTCWPSICFFGKMSIQMLCPFFNWNVCFFAVELHEFLNIFWILSDTRFANVFSLSRSISSFLMNSLCSMQHTPIAPLRKVPVGGVVYLFSSILGSRKLIDR